MEYLYSGNPCGSRASGELSIDTEEIRYIKAGLSH